MSGCETGAGDPQGVLAGAMQCTKRGLCSQQQKLLGFSFSPAQDKEEEVTQKW